MKNHPLFTIDCDLNDADQAAKAALDIGFIHVFKVDLGKARSAGRQFKAEELPTYESFVQLFGGGDYELRGRPPDNSGFCNIVHLSIDGSAKNPTGITSDPRDPQAYLPQPAPSPLAGAGGLLELLTLLKAMQPAAPPAQDAAVLVAMINAQSAMSTNVMAMISSQAQSAATNQLELVKALAQPPQGGNNPGAIQDSFMRGIQSMGEIIQKFKPGGEKEKEPFPWETINTIVENLMGSVTAGRDALALVNQAGAAPAVPAVAEVSPSVHNAAAA